MCLSFITPLPPRPGRPERLFIGIKPDRAAARRLDALHWRLVDDLGLEGTQIPAGRLHVSLHHVRDDTLLRSRYILAARQAAAAIRMAPFDVVFDSVETFPSPPGRAHRRPTVLRGGGDGLTALHQALGAALARTGLRIATAFRAHITLCYGPCAVARQAVGPVSFTVADFALIHSERGLGRHTILDRWPLVQPGPPAAGSGCPE